MVFISGKSTELQLENILKWWCNELNNHKFINIILIDFAKDVYVVPYKNYYMI